MIVRDFNAGPPSSRSGFSGAASLGDAGNALLFNATEGTIGLELWRTDDTGNNPNNIALLQDIAPGPASSQPETFTRAKNLVFFTANDAERGRELWVMPAFGQNLPEAAIEHRQSPFSYLPRRHGVPLQDFEMLENIPNKIDGEGEPPDMPPGQ